MHQSINEMVNSRKNKLEELLHKIDNVTAAVDTHIAGIKSMDTPLGTVSEIADTLLSPKKSSSKWKTGLKGVGALAALGAAAYGGKKLYLKLNNNRGSGAMNSSSLVKNAEVRGVLAGLASTGHIKIASDEALGVFAEVVTSLIPANNYDINTVLSKTAEVVEFMDKEASTGKHIGNAVKRFLSGKYTPQESLTAGIQQLRSSNPEFAGWMNGVVYGAEAAAKAVKRTAPSTVKSKVLKGAGALTGLAALTYGGKKVYDKYTKTAAATTRLERMKNRAMPKVYAVRDKIIGKTPAAVVGAEPAVQQAPTPALVRKNTPDFVHPQSRKRGIVRRRGTPTLGGATYNYPTAVPAAVPAAGQSAFRGLLKDPRVVLGLKGAGALTGLAALTYGGKSLYDKYVR